MSILKERLLNLINKSDSHQKEEIRLSIKSVLNKETAHLFIKRKLTEEFKDAGFIQPFKTNENAIYIMNPSRGDLKYIIKHFEVDISPIPSRKAHKGTTPHQNIHDSPPLNQINHESIKKEGDRLLKELKSQFDDSDLKGVSHEERKQRSNIRKSAFEHLESEIKFNHELLMGIQKEDKEITKLIWDGLECMGAHSGDLDKVGQIFQHQYDVAKQFSTETEEDLNVHPNLTKFIMEDFKKLDIISTEIINNNFGQKSVPYKSYDKSAPIYCAKYTVASIHSSLNTVVPDSVLKENEPLIKEIFETVLPNIGKHKIGQLEFLKKLTNGVLDLLQDSKIIKPDDREWWQVYFDHGLKLIENVDLSKSVKYETLKSSFRHFSAGFEKYNKDFFSGSLEKVFKFIIYLVVGFGVILCISSAILTHREGHAMAFSNNSYIRGDYNAFTAAAKEMDIKVDFVNNPAKSIRDVQNGLKESIERKNLEIKQRRMNQESETSILNNQFIGLKDLQEKMLEMTGPLKEEKNDKNEYVISPICRGIIDTSITNGMAEANNAWFKQDSRFIQGVNKIKNDLSTRSENLRKELAKSVYLTTSNEFSKEISGSYEKYIADLEEPEKEAIKDAYKNFKDAKQSTLTFVKYITEVSHCHEDIKKYLSEAEYKNGGIKDLKDSIRLLKRDLKEFGERIDGNYNTLKDLSQKINIGVAELLNIERSLLVLHNTNKYLMTDANTLSRVDRVQMAGVALATRTKDQEILLHSITQIALLEGLSPNTMINSVFEYMGIGNENEELTPTQKFVSYFSGGACIDQVEKAMKSVWVSITKLGSSFSNIGKEGAIPTFVKYTSSSFISSILLGILYVKLEFLGNMYKNIEAVSLGVKGIITSKTKLWMAETSETLKANAEKAKDTINANMVTTRVYKSNWDGYGPVALNSVWYSNWLLNNVTEAITNVYTFSKFSVPFGLIGIRILGIAVFIDWVMALATFVYATQVHPTQLFTGSESNGLLQSLEVGAYITYKYMPDFGSYIGIPNGNLLGCLTGLFSYYSSDLRSYLFKFVVGTFKSLTNISDITAYVSPPEDDSRSFRERNEQYSLDAMRYVITLYHFSTDIVTKQISGISQRIVAGALGMKNVNWPSNDEYKNRRFIGNLIPGKRDENDQYLSLVKSPATKILTSIGITVTPMIIYYLLFQQANIQAVLPINNTILEYLSHFGSSEYNGLLSHKIIKLYSDYIPEVSSFSAQVIAKNCNLAIVGTTQFIPPTTYDLEILIDALLGFYTPVRNIVQNLTTI